MFQIGPKCLKMSGCVLKYKGAIFLCLVLLVLLSLTVSSVWVSNISRRTLVKQVLQKFIPSSESDTDSEQEEVMAMMKQFFPGYVPKTKQSRYTTLNGEPGICPAKPQGLVGKLNLTATTTLNELLDKDVLMQVLPGGAYTPADCEPLQDVAIIVTYRNTQNHLDIFLMHIHTVLQRQMMKYTIYVVELALPTRFNRGILANIGFLTAIKARRHDCFIIHDVDLLPSNDMNMYSCSPFSPRHLSVSISRFGFGLLHDEYFGGVNAFTETQFRTVNGFSNKFFGVGGDDDDLYFRVTLAGYEIERPATHIGIYEALGHEDDSKLMVPEKPQRADVFREVNLSFNDGLNSTEYTQLTVEHKPLYTWVYVQVSELKMAEEMLKKLQEENEVTERVKRAFRRTELETKNMARYKNRGICPKVPSGLVGLLAVSPKTSLNDLLNDEVLKKIKPGGVYKPSDCKPVDNVAVIIPYRDRQEHLDIFLMHIHTVLQRQMLQYTIYVVELALPTQFNRGILANIGFVTAASLSKHTCYIIHDVDLLPANDKNMYTCSTSPRHLSVANSKFKYKLPYDIYFGGVCAFTEKQFRKINGFPNRFFGWGGEDDNLYARVVTAGYKIERPSPIVGHYEALWHSSDAGNPENPLRFMLLCNNKTKLANDGLSSLQFHRLSLEFRPLYTWVYVRVKEQEIMTPLLDT